MGSLFSSPYHSDPSLFATKAEGPDPYTLDEALELYKAYDYIIVGAGAAGCVLAHRLSEDPAVSVLLVEAGGSHEGNTLSQIPIGFGKLLKTSWDWEYYTTPQPNLHDRKLFWPQGKVLGGSTSINGMMYQHCSPSDFDEWEKLGAHGWSFKDISPYFRKSEKFTPHVLYPDVKIEERGDSGLWQTSYTYIHPITKKFIDSAQEVGIPINPDINTPRGSLGVSKFITFIDPKGSRSSAATAYLQTDVAARKNLTIVIETMTTRVLLSSDPVPRAMGIEISKGSNSPFFRISARKEVILSAGALNTPKILNLSGIGAEEELAKFDIKVVKELSAVGKNMVDHLASGAITFRAKKGTSLDFMADSIKSLPYILRWFLTGKGPASSNVGEAAAFVRTTDPKLPFGYNADASKSSDVRDATSGPESPDMELICAPLAYLQHGFQKAPSGSECLTIYPILLRPLSSGSVYLSSASPFDKATPEPNYFSHPNDIKVLLRGVRLALRIGRAHSLQSQLELPNHSADKKSVFWPGDANPDAVTDEELDEWLRGNAETLYHPMGTCKIGHDEKDSVVDFELKVHGVKGLRVIDASVFPSPVSGHPTATVIAIAEKASDMIRKVHKEII